MANIDEKMATIDKAIADTKAMSREPTYKTPQSEEPKKAKEKTKVRKMGRGFGGFEM